jgi:alpha-beta hydrolase superfamily lysophospholipase
MPSKLSDKPHGVFHGKDETELPYWCWNAKKPKAILIGLHGAFVHARRLRFVAKYLQKQGYTFYAYNMRGHGLLPVQTTDIKNFKDYIDDLYQVSLTVREQHMNLDLFLIGHSLGSLIGLAFAIEHPDIFKGVIASSPWLGTGIKVSGSKLLLAGLLKRLKPTKTLWNQLILDHLTRDQKVLASHKADPFRSDNMTVRWFFATRNGQRDTVAAAPELRIPCLILQAGDDKIVDIGITKTFFEAVTSTDKTYKEYNGFYHELFNEIDRKIVFKDISDWLNKHIAANSLPQ